MSQPTSPLPPEALLSHTDFVRILARHLLEDPGAADDLAQDTLARALERPPRAAVALRAWLRTVARNFARQGARGATRRRYHEAEAARAEAVPSADEVLEREAVRAEVVEALLSLPEVQRDVLLLRFYEGLAPREIARRLEVPVETVRSRQRRGIAGMRRRLDGRRERGDWMPALAPLAFARGEGVGLVGAARGATTLLAVGGAKKAGVALVVLAAAGAWWGTRGGAPAPSANPTPGPVATAPLEVPEAPRELAGEVRAPVASTDGVSSGETWVRGRVVTPEGLPLSGAGVYVSREGPLTATGIARRKVAWAESERGAIRMTETDEEGAFRIEAHEPGRVHVGLVFLADPFFHPGAGLRVDAPAEDVELVAAPAPVAVLAARATLAASGAPVEGFTALLWSTATNRTTQVHEKGVLLELEVPLAEGLAEEAFDLSIEAAGLGEVQERVTLLAGTRTEVELFFEESETVRGTVVDERDRPVEGALVYFGIQELMRGDEPFKPYDPSRVKNGVRTDRAGAFELTGRGDRITAWHADLSPRTVERDEVDRIVLPPRSAVKGVVLDELGAPVAGLELVMDRARKCVTDDAGRFEFLGLEAGVRGLKLGSGSMFALDVPPSETMEVVLSTGLTNVTVELQQGGLPTDLAPKDAVFLVGEGRVFSLQESVVRDGRLDLEDVLPGDYWILSAQGLVVRARIDAPFVGADVGTSSLLVRGAPGRSVFVAPADGNELVWLMANRIAQRRLPASGELEIGPLPAGEYVVGAEGVGELGRTVLEADRRGRLELE